MKDTNEQTGGDFSVREQFAKAGSARPAHQAAAPRPVTPTPPVRTAGPTNMPHSSLRRPITPENMIQLVDWGQLARGLWRRAWLVALLAAAGLSLGLYGRSQAGGLRYEARASVLYRAERQKQALTSSGSSLSIKGLARATAVSLLRRAGNLEKVIAQLKLDMKPDELGWRMQTQSERNSEIVLLHVESMPSAKLAVAAANAFAQIGIEDNRNFYRNQVLQLVEQFKRQAAVATADEAAARKALTAFQTQHQLLEVGADTKAFLDSMGAVNERLNAARIARDAQTVRIVNYQRLVKELPDEVLRESYEDDPLKRQIANSELALMEARTRYGPQNPRVLQMEDSLREMRKTMSAKTFDETRERVYEKNPAKQEFEKELLRLEAEQEVLTKTVTQVGLQADALKAKYGHLPAQQIELAGFYQRHTAAAALVQSLEKSIADATMVADLDLADFAILESARTATASRGRIGALLPVIGLVLCFFAGIGLCAVLTLADPRLKSAGQIERLYTLPCLGAVCDAKGGDVSAAFIPICRALYLRFSSDPASEGARMLGVLSARPGDGKSTFAFQLARYWAGLGIKTACLDFDSAPNPALSPDRSQAGLEDYLAGHAVWDEVLFMRDGVACFKRMSDSGDLPERMHGTAMLRLMETLRGQFERVIVEAPAWTADGASAQMLARLMDQSVWVAASTISTRTVLGAAFDGLDRTGLRPLGLVLNRSPSASGMRGRRNGAS